MSFWGLARKERGGRALSLECAKMARILRHDKIPNQAGNRCDFDSSRVIKLALLCGVSLQFDHCKGNRCFAIRNVSALSLSHSDRDRGVGHLGSLFQVCPFSCILLVVEEGSCIGEELAHGQQRK